MPIDTTGFSHVVLQLLPNQSCCIRPKIPPTLVAWSCAPESARSQRGESPLQVNALQPVTECNCDVAMRSGEQQEVNDQSVG